MCRLLFANNVKVIDSFVTILGKNDAEPTLASSSSHFKDSKWFWMVNFKDLVTIYDVIMVYG